MRRPSGKTAATCPGMIEREKTEALDAGEVAT